LEHLASAKKTHYDPSNRPARHCNSFTRTFCRSASARYPSPEPPRLLDRVRRAARVRHYSPRTEHCYVEWIIRYIRFHGLRHPNTMGGAEIEMFLTDLAVRGQVSASTQNQAFNALLFLYQQVLGIELPRLDAVRARRPKRLPTVLSAEDVRQLLEAV